MTPRDIEKILQTSYGLPCAGMVPVYDGPDSEVYKILLENGVSVAFRCSKYPKNCSDYTFEHELLDFLRKQGYPVATVLPSIASYYDPNITVSTWVDGSKIDVSKDNKPDLAICCSAGKKLAELHKLTTNFKPRETPNREVDAELKGLLAHREKVAKTFQNGSDFCEAVEAVLSRTKDFSKQTPCIIHNDYRAKNLLADSYGRISAVLDFDWACPGQPMKDLAHALVEWSYPDGATGHWPDVWQEFLEGYCSVSTKAVNYTDIYYWSQFSTLSDASTYVLSLLKSIESADTEKPLIRSYMYGKYKYLIRNCDAFLVPSVQE